MPTDFSEIVEVFEIPSNQGWANILHSPQHGGTERCFTYTECSRETCVKLQDGVMSVDIRKKNYIIIYVRLSTVTLPREFQWTYVDVAENFYHS